MKILLLMPCDEQHVYAAAGIYKALEAKVKDVTFAIPMFMDYLINGKLVENWIYSLLWGLTAAKSSWENSGNKDLLIIGNVPKECTFDMVFNFQEIEESLPYKDNFIEKSKEVILENLNKENSEDVKRVLTTLSDVHEASESTMALHNIVATADLLSALMKTDPHLEDIRAKYEKRIKDFNEIDRKAKQEMKKKNNDKKRNNNNND